MRFKACQDPEKECYDKIIFSVIQGGSWKHVGLWLMSSTAYVKFWQLTMVLMVCVVDADLNWRGLWTWPPGMTCVPALNHKFKKFSTFSGVMKSFYLRNLTSGQKCLGLDNEKATPWIITAQKLPNRRANSRWPTDWPNHPLVWHSVVLS